MTYAFTFDSSACSGCKACQEACKDKNNLPVGVMWRRVVEVSGGEWMNVGAGSPRPGVDDDVSRVGESDRVRRPDPYTVWENTVFAYNLSIACNHCVHPKCAGVCPVDAYVIRSDGIIFIDTSKCMGCGYCAWACPYGAPQYNPELGQMTKCNFCFDNIDAGLPPSCVAACPMRVLNFVEVDHGQRTTDDAQSSIVHGQWSELWELPASEHPFPLPQNSHTEPHFAIKPHLAMSLPLEKKISNREEIKPKKQKSEISLLVFTLLAQMAVGAFWAAQWIWNLVEFDARLLRLIPYLIIGACLGTGGFFSFAHLGSKHNAWRSLTYLRKSWLSREVLYVGLFGAGWLASIAPLPWQALAIIRAITSLFGIALLFSMANVYRLQTMPSWNTWRTPISFFITAILLGQLLMLNVLTVESQFTGINLSSAFIRWIGGITIALLAGELGVWFSAKENVNETVNRLRVGLIVAAILGAWIMSIATNQFGVRISLPILLVVMVEEIIGRWLFYEALKKRIF